MNIAFANHTSHIYSHIENLGILPLIKTLYIFSFKEFVVLKIFLRHFSHLI